MIKDKKHLKIRLANGKTFIMGQNKGDPRMILNYITNLKRLLND